MDAFFHANVSRWDSALRIIVASALVGAVLVVPSAATAALSLLMPYFLFTVVSSWDPIYGLVNWISASLANSAASGTTRKVINAG